MQKLDLAAFRFSRLYIDLQRPRIEDYAIRFSRLIERYQSVAHIGSHSFGRSFLRRSVAAARLPSRSPRIAPLQ